MDRVNLRRLLNPPLRGQHNGPIADAQPSSSTLLGNYQPSVSSGHRDLFDQNRVSSFNICLQALLSDI